VAGFFCPVGRHSYRRRQPPPTLATSVLPPNGEKISAAKRKSDRQKFRRQQFRLRGKRQIVQKYFVPLVAQHTQWTPPPIGFAHHFLPTQKTELIRRLKIRIFYQTDFISDIQWPRRLVAAQYATFASWLDSKLRRASVQWHFAFLFPSSPYRLWFIRYRSHFPASIYFTAMFFAHAASARIFFGK
jgi:hypothetical protein